jgi:hypothetical protein
MSTKPTSSLHAFFALRLTRFASKVLLEACIQGLETPKPCKKEPKFLLPAARPVPRARRDPLPTGPASKCDGGYGYGYGYGVRGMVTAMATVMAMATAMAMAMAVAMGLRLWLWPWQW